MHELHVIDSHTEGEPTRVVVDFYLPHVPMLELREILSREHDLIRQCLTREPWGTPVQVGAFLTKPHDPSCQHGLVFFNNAGYLGMCGHGTIGLVRTLAYLDRLAPGVCRIDTPAGPVEAELLDSGKVRIQNVPSFRFAGATVRVHGRTVTGEVAYGGNWFFITHDCLVPLDKSHLAEVDAYAKAIQAALDDNGITGSEGARIDHVEICVPSLTPGMNSRNYVLCPGGEYDRSPCGTGTSAHMACLFASGKLEEGAGWRQESILGTEFEGSVRVSEGKLIPTIIGRAWITGDARVLIAHDDPMRP